MQIIYRISDSGYKKEKPEYINNENCLENALKTFPPETHKWIIIADSVSSETRAMIDRTAFQREINIIDVCVGHGAGTFNLVLDEALKLEDNEIVYFLENDYLHKYPGSYSIMLEAFNLGADYVTLYLHPDKFISPDKGGNPNVDSDGGYLTKIYRGDRELFGLFESTTMTFAARVRTLKKDENVLRQFTTGNYPKDFEMFNALRIRGRALLCPLNSYSTHGETRWLGVMSGINRDLLIEEWKIWASEEDFNIL